MKSWYPVIPKKYYNTVTSLLQEDKTRWQGMKLVGELRREKQIPIPHQSDSVYKPVIRSEKRFKPLKIPRTLQAGLPFASKPKVPSKRSKPTYETRRAVILEGEEKRVYKLMQQIRTLQNENLSKKKLKAQADYDKYQKKKQAEADKFAPVLSEKRKDFFKKGDKEKKRQTAQLESRNKKRRKIIED